MIPEHLSVLSAHRHNWLSIGREADGVEFVWREGVRITRIMLPVSWETANEILGAYRTTSPKDFPLVPPGTFPYG